MAAIHEHLSHTHDSSLEAIFRAQRDAFCQDSNPDYAKRRNNLTKLLRLVEKYEEELIHGIFTPLTAK